MKKKHYIYLAIGTFLFIIFLFIWLYLMTGPYLIKGFNFSDTGQIGDTIGGLTSPLIGVASSVLLFIAFFEQRKANDLQREALNNEKSRYEAERFYQYNLNLLNDLINKFDNLEMCLVESNNQSELEIYKGNVVYRGATAFYIIQMLVNLDDNQKNAPEVQFGVGNFTIVFLKFFRELGKFVVELELQNSKFPKEVNALKKIASSMFIMENIGYFEDALKCLTKPEADNLRVLHSSIKSILED